METRRQGPWQVEEAWQEATSLPRVELAKEGDEVKLQNNFVTLTFMAL